MMTFDPLDAATQAGERSSAYFGKVEVSAQFVALIKGMGKVAWQESHGIDQRRTEISLHLNPIDEMGLSRAIDRQLIAESREWSGIVWASLRDLGLKHARELHGRFVRAELVKTGRTYTGRDGSTVENTTLKFTALYGSQAECAAAYRAEFGGAAPAPAAVPTAAAANDAERMTALQFLPALVKAANGDRGQLAMSLASMPMIAKYFTVDSPEVSMLLGGSH